MSNDPLPTPTVALEGIRSAALSCAATFASVLPIVKSWAESRPEPPDGPDGPPPGQDDHPRFLVDQLEAVLRLNPRGDMESLGAILQTLNEISGRPPNYGERRFADVERDVNRNGNAAEAT